VRFHSIVFRRGGLAAYACLVLGCGVVLMLSMPWAGRLGELITFPWRPAPITFFYAHLLLTCVVALNRGAAVEPLYRLRVHTLVSLPLQLLLALVLVLPYLVFMRVLIPESRTFIPLFAAYVTLTGTLFAGLSFSVELVCLRRGVPSNLIRQATALAVVGLPLLGLLAPPAARWIALASPAYALWRLNLGVGWGEALVAFALPAALAAATYAFAWTRLQKERYA